MPTMKIRSRVDIVRFLGGQCVECGEDDVTVLELDHKNGDGVKEWALTGRFRRSAAQGGMSGSSHVCVANKLGLPYIRETRQVLCANCHTRKTSRAREYANRGVGHVSKKVPEINQPQVDLFHAD